MTLFKNIKIGLLGGLGPESTLIYYRGIIDAFKPEYDKTGFPEIIIESVNLWQFMHLEEQGKWDVIAQMISQRFENMRHTGASFGAMATNTPHKVFNKILEHTSLPLLSIVTAARDVAHKHHLTKLLLLGTKFTMRSDFYQKEFSQSGIDIVVPNEAEQDYINDKIFSEIELGIIKKSTKQEFLDIINHYKSAGIEGVILGCTELPMLIKQNDIDLAYLDSTHIHINRIVYHCQQEQDNL